MKNAKEARDHLIYNKIEGHGSSGRLVKWQPLQYLIVKIKHQKGCKR